MEQRTVSAVDLKEVKDILGVNLKPEQVLLQAITTKNSDIILPEGMSIPPHSRLVVIKVGERVKDLKISDVMLDWKNESALKFYYKGDDKYLVTESFNISLSTSNDNTTEE